MRKTLVFVALGDSLTVGFQTPTVDEPWPMVVPYTHFLEHMIGDMLRRSGTTSLNVQIHNRGINGDLTSGMLFRFRRDVVDLRPDYVIILGGSNDIGWGLSPKVIFNNLMGMYTTVRANDVEPIACTIPSILGFDLYIKPRLELNSLIQKHCLERGINCVDLFNSTSDPQTKRLLEEYSNDGLHLNTRGYETMAETVFYEAVEEIIASSVRESR